MLPPDLFESLADDPMLAAKEISCAFVKFHKDKGGSSAYYSEYVDWFSVLDALKEIGVLDLNIPAMNKDDADIPTIVNSFYKVLLFAKFKGQNTVQIGLKQVQYEFDGNDFDRVQKIINELRDIITASKVFDDDFKDRILKKVNKLQSELSKKMSTLDQFWGLLGDAGVALGKFGEYAKPVVDRVGELIEIAWRTQSRSEGLPDNTALPFPESKQIESQEN